MKNCCTTLAEIAAIPQDLHLCLELLHRESIHKVFLIFSSLFLQD
jgi:hypothetical protein